MLGVTSDEDILDRWDFVKRDLDGHQFGALVALWARFKGCTNIPGGRAREISGTIWMVNDVIAYEVGPGESTGSEVRVAVEGKCGVVSQDV